MLKVHGVMAEGFVLKERSWRRPEGLLQERLSQADTVTISEEGKKRRILGHVLASISGPENGKRG